MPFSNARTFSKIALAALTLSATLFSPASHAEMNLMSVLRNAINGFSEPPASSTRDSVDPISGPYAPVSVSSQCTQSVAQMVQVHAQLQNKSVAHCYQAFSVLYNSNLKTALASLEYVIPANIQQARKLPRNADFYPNVDLVRGETSPQLNDFRGSGYQRGHLAPSGNAWTYKARYETFGLINIIAQNGPLNEQGWNKVESTLRNFVVNNRTPIWIATGPAFQGKVKRLSNGSGPAIPSHLWKAVWFPAQKAAGAVWVANDSSQVFEYITLQELYNRTGVNVFPALSADLRNPNAQSLRSSFKGLFRGLKTVHG